MKLRLHWKKGAILLQTLVMSVILSMISVMILKWIMARYIIVARIQQSAKNTGNAQGYAALNVKTWTTPANASTTMDLKSVSFQQVSTGKFVTTVTDEY
ncbi:MAG: hypothetical protein WCK75_03970 [Elusimicrobiota bacterium]